MRSDEIRSRFIKFFETRGHLPLPSSSLIPAGDPTLLFTNAGMVQFKSIFLGETDRPAPRAVTSQKCVRAGGKHNDLENVGHTARHHTFFEMLGNFSFGDYFKRDAIRWAWEFLTVEMGLPREKLWATVYLDDDEAAALWREEAGIAADRIVRLGEKDNFWSMGDTGPCGPCSEIIIDQGPGIGCGRPECAVGCDCDRYLELWNLVFMQYNRDGSGVLSPLPKPSIDTGMGLERLSAVMQGKHNNFDSDLFLPLINAIAKISGKHYPANEESENASMRVIADHIRSTTFLLADGLLPSNEGRGYVMRRIIRRAGRHGRMLGIEGPFLHKLVDDLVGLMGGIYPELQESPDRIKKILRHEEERFSTTLRQGLGILEGLIRDAKAAGLTTIPGADLFRLYDTFGFPLDLAGDIASDAGFSLDLEGFNREMETQKTRARASWVGSGAEEAEPYYRELSRRISTTRFVGYENTKAQGKILAILREGVEVNEAGEGQEIEIFLDTTPFYAESGGQVGDTGDFFDADGKKLVHVLDTKKHSGLHAHRAEVRKGHAIQVGMTVAAAVDDYRRHAIMRNHTATHLLQAALRDVLGDHVKQAGSLVEPDRLRFDYTHFSALTQEEIREIEDWVNDRDLENIPVHKAEMAIDEALASGVTALFGEKYGERVRVIRVGSVSSELCGGTHADATGEIGLFKIVSDSSVAAGMRRIEAVTGRAALQYLRDRENEIRSVADLLKSPDNLSQRIQKLQTDLKTREREIQALKEKSSASAAGDLFSRARDIGGVKILATRVDGMSPADLRTQADSLKDRMGSGAVMLASAADGKVSLICTVTKDLAGKKLHAGNILRDVAARVGAKGGGRPDMAQGGLKDEVAIPEALDAFYEIVEKSIS